MTNRLTAIQTEREKNRQAGIQVDRQTDIYIERKTDRYSRQEFYPVLKHRSKQTNTVPICTNLPILFGDVSYTYERMRG